MMAPSRSVKNSASGFVVIILLAFTGCPQRPGRSTTPVQLTVMMSSDATGDWHRLFEEFHRQNPGISVNLIEGPTTTNGREDQYVTSFLSGLTDFDLIYADVVWIPKFAAAGWLEDLTDRWPAERWNRFIPGSIEGSKYKDRIYRVPTQLNGGLLFYRSDLLAAAGEHPPETFSDLMRICKSLQKPDDLWGFVWQGKQYEGLACDFLEVLAGYGGTWINAGTGEVGLDKPPAIEALKFLRSCVDEKISPPGVTTYTEEESRQIFQSGHAIFLRNWPYVWPLSQTGDSPVRGKVGIAPMPHANVGKSASTLGGWGFAIAKSSLHKDEAWKFCQYISDLPQIRKLNQGTGLEPALKAFYDETADPAGESIYKVMLATVPRPMVPQYAQASDILQRYVSEALTGRIDPEKALKEAARETRLLLGRK